MRAQTPAIVLTIASLSGCLPEFPAQVFVEDPTHDADGDGFTEIDGDCDDDSTLVYPGAPEICDDRDNDCDGRSDELTDADDDNFVEDPPVWYLDADGDAFGDTNRPTLACTAPAGHVADSGDCDDTRFAVNPGQTEVCDGGLDNDCNGLTDDNDPDMTGDATWYRDADADGYGDPDSTLTQCDPPPGYVLRADDCDDANRRVYLGAAELCDEVDNDCDGLVDDNDDDPLVGLAPWYADTDGDGYGDPTVWVEACAPPEGYGLDNTDCDDQNPDAYPGATEVCDEADNDCDSQVDEADAADASLWYADSDGDGYGDADRSVTACAAPPTYVADDTDCDDARALVYPTAPERCATPTIDDDCDGDMNDPGADGCETFYLDADGDGYGETAATQCTCTADTTTGYTAAEGGDCDDTSTAVSPAALEDCSTPSTDDDCDGDTNDAGALYCSYFWADLDLDGYGDSSDSACLCLADAPYEAAVDGDCDETDYDINPGADELCADAIDNNCDGLTDDGTAVDASTWYLDADADGYGLTTSTTSACEQPSGYTDVDGDCDDTRDGLNPGMTEDCLTTFDDDCSGTTNDVGADACTTFYADADGDGYGVAADTQCTCEADTSTVYTSRVTEDCDDTDAAISPGDTETCSTAGVDDDCDGTADNEDADGCTNYFYDFDGDSYGINDYRCLCATDGYYTAATLGDCDDADSSVNPAAANCGLNGTVRSSQAAAMITGRSTIQSNNGYGFNVASTLDYNRDGAVDVVVGSSGENTSYTTAGAVYLWLNDGAGISGSHAADTSGTASLRFVYDGLRHGCGYYVSAGDVDADGYDEVLVGCHGAGSSFLLDDGLDGLGTVTPTTAGVTEFAGYQVALLVGDLNDDGYTDGLLAPSESNSGWSAPIYLAWGDASGLTPSASSVLVTSHNDSTNSSSLGRVVSAADIDGDGVEDLLLQYGSVIDIHAGGAAFSTTKTFRNSHAGSYAYSPIQPVGDMTGDGYPDVAVGDHTVTSTDPFTGSTLQTGAAWLYQGGVSSGGPAFIAPSGATSLGSYDYVWKLEGSGSELLGIDVAAAGDIDDDGFDDILIMATTMTYLLYGPLDATGATYSRTIADASIYTTARTRDIAPAGDVNADGYDDIWLGGSSTYLFHGTPR